MLLYNYDRLEENGQTALGPALVISILLAARSSGSQVSMLNTIDLICATILYLCHSLPDGKNARISISCRVCGCRWREVAFGSFDSPRPQTWWDCRKKLSNNRNGRQQLIVVLVEFSLLLVLPKVAIAGKSVWMVYLLGSELGSLLHHGNPYCTLCTLPSFTAIQL